MKNIVILSNRDHAMRIQSAITHFRRLKTQWLQRYLMKSVRILLMSYHEALVGTQDTKGASVFAQAGEVDCTYRRYVDHVTRRCRRRPGRT